MEKTISLKGKRVLVTGGAGFVGSHLVDRLIREHVSALVVVDDFSIGNMENLIEAKKAYPALEVLDGDAADYELMKETMRTYKIQVVFHLATVCLPISLERPVYAMQSITDMTITACRLLHEGEYETLIQFSSSEAYGSAKAAPMSETHLMDPETPYAAAKAGADHIALSYHHTFGLDIAIVRPFNQYGPRQNKKDFSGVIPRTIASVQAGGEIVIYGDGEQTRDFSYVTDTVDAAILAYENPATRGKAINIGSGEELSINDLMRMLAHELGYTKPIRREPARPGDVRRHLADITLAKQLLGWRPTTPFPQGLHTTVAWYKAQ